MAELCCSSEIALVLVHQKKKQPRFLLVFMNRILTLGEVVKFYSNTFLQSACICFTVMFTRITTLTNFRCAETAQLDLQYA